MNIDQAKANRARRKAWMYLGEARQIKLTWPQGDPIHFVHLARISMHTAIFYQKQANRHEKLRDWAARFAGNVERDD